ncbi:MAG TPA: hypothetical protein PL064_09275, partial [Thermogutta sp.]|nr:hypothetical protein [Thermogutta sp.]
DYIEWIGEDQRKQLLRVVSLSDDDIEFRLPNDARPMSVIKRERGRIRANYSKLFKRNTRKVWVTPLGEVRPAND